MTLALGALSGDGEGPRLTELARRHLGPVSAERLAGPEPQAAFEEALRGGKDELDALLSIAYPLALRDREVAGEFLGHFLKTLLGNGRNHLSTRLRSTYGAEDLVQSVVGDLLPRLGELEFGTRGEFLSLLLMRLNWKAGRRGRAPQPELDPTALEEALPEQVPGREEEVLTPLSALAAEENEGLVVLAIHRLCLEDQQLIRWSMEGRTREWMARELGLSRPTLRKRLERARRRLRRELDRLGGLTGDDGDDRPGAGDDDGAPDDGAADGPE